MYGCDWKEKNGTESSRKIDESSGTIFHGGARAAERRWVGLVGPGLQGSAAESKPSDAVAVQRKTFPSLELPWRASYSGLHNV
jgi:hypothetical protein